MNHTAEKPKLLTPRERVRRWEVRTWGEWTIDDFEGYAQSYRDAAKELTGQHIIGELWAYPIVFLYRHAFELLIKEILTCYGGNVGICGNCILTRGHSLQEQVPDLIRVATNCGFSLSDSLQTMLEAWDRDDPQGMTARYPRSKKGKRKLLVKDHTFDLRKFSRDCEAHLDELQELLGDLRREESAEIEADALSPKLSR